MRSDIILPSEIQSREFDGKLLTACVIAERGRTAIIGARHEVHNRIARLPASTYLAKDLTKPSTRILKLIRGLGLSVAALDEEGAIWTSEAAYYGRRTTPETAGMIDLYCTWGPRHEALTLGIPGIRDVPVIATGNPRNDLLRPELRAFYDSEANELRERFGPFILINSNFGMVNPISMAKSLSPETMKAQHPDVIARFERRKAVFAEIRALVPVLCAAFPDTQVIIRPHPAERIEAWTDLKTSSPNLHVIREGEVIPWLLAAHAMVHNECSTGVESFMLDRLSISYQGVATARDDGLSADAFSEIVTDAAGVIAAIQRRLDNGPVIPDAQQKAALGAHFSALDGPLAAERLADQLLTLETKRPRQMKAWIKAEKRGLEKRLYGLIPGHKAGAAHNSQRYPGVSPSELNDKLDRLRAALGRFGNVHAEPLGGQLYRVKRTS